MKERQNASKATYSCLGDWLFPRTFLLIFQKRKAEMGLRWRMFSSHHGAHNEDSSKQVVSFFRNILDCMTTTLYVKVHVPCKATSNLGYNPGASSPLGLSETTLTGAEWWIPHARSPLLPSEKSSIHVGTVAYLPTCTPISHLLSRIHPH